MQYLRQARRGTRGNIDEYIAIAVQEMVEQRKHCRFANRRVFLQRLERGQHAEPFPDAGHAAFEKQLVHTLRMFQRLAQRMARGCVDLQGGITELEVEIQQRYPALEFSARYQAVATPTVVAPTPPRTPSTNTSFPVLDAANPCSPSGCYGRTA